MDWVDAALLEEIGLSLGHDLRGCRRWETPTGSVLIHVPGGDGSEDECKGMKRADSRETLASEGERAGACVLKVQRGGAALERRVWALPCAHLGRPVAHGWARAASFALAPQGVDLWRRSAHRAFAPWWVRGVAKALLTALQSLHDAGIAHLDVKPQNMLCYDDVDSYFHLFDGAVGASAMHPKLEWSTMGESTMSTVAGEADGEGPAGEPHKSTPLDHGPTCENGRSRHATQKMTTTSPSEPVVNPPILPHVVLTDFGLSCEIGKWVEARGTYGFVAPELRGRAAWHVAPASDLWAAGAVLFALLGGYAPFAPGVTLLQFPHRYWGHTTDNCKAFLQGLLEPDPALRLTAHQGLNHPWMFEG